MTKKHPTILETVSEMTKSLKKAHIRQLELVPLENSNQTAKGKIKIRISKITEIRGNK